MLVSLLVLLVFLMSASWVVQSTNAPVIVHPGVHRALQAHGAVDLIVTMKKKPLKALESAEATTLADGSGADSLSRGKAISNLVASLESIALESQSGIVKSLSQESSTSPFTTSSLYSSKQSFWISNQVFFEQASAELVNKLKNVDEILEIRPQLVLPLPELIHATPSSRGRMQTKHDGVPLAEWGVVKIQAPQVWASNNTAQDVIMSTIDSGVRGTHEALNGSFRGDFGWYDPEKKADKPYDNVGHGTHTMGTIVGHNGIGVAPGATWMTCKGCRTTGCPESDLLACAQFIMCPHDPNGNNKDCSKAPRLVSNSWGGGQGRTFYQDAVDAWHKAGIIPIFANGNSGSQCQTANSPGDFANVIAVGATDVNDALANFSSKGPSVNGLLKPQVSAPGVNVRSAWNSGDSEYNSISGTSMATPHVAGIAALILHGKPNISYEEMKALLQSSVDTSSLQLAGKTCGNTTDGVFPNNNFGYGRVNAVKATE